MTEHQIREAFRKVLTSEGFAPEVTESGELLFKFEGHPYSLTVDPNDEGFIQIVRHMDFGGHTQDPERGRVHALCAAADANFTHKCAKAALNDRHDLEDTSVVITAESFVDQIASLPPILIRLLTAARGCANRFTELYLESLASDKVASEEPPQVVSTEDAKEVDEGGLAAPVIDVPGQSQSN